MILFPHMFVLRLLQCLHFVEIDIGVLFNVDYLFIIIIIFGLSFELVRKFCCLLFFLPLIIIIIIILYMPLLPTR